MKNSEKQQLAVVWTSSDPEVAEKVCFMYTQNATLKGWFDEVVLVVWGPSAKLLSENKILQERVKQMIADGVKVEACVACANMYGVADQLAAMGIEVKGMGPVLTVYLKENWKVLTF
ncbi:MAG TPA: DsrE family protein [Prolixibacteraceae bacterium]|nr:DsrE family protein [Prolixibacteraceae bacterium]